MLFAFGHSRLVDELGLHSTLSQYSVPKEDLPKIAELQIGNKTDVAYEKVAALLDALHA